MYHINGKIEGIADILFNAPPPIEDEKSGTKHPSKMSPEELRREALNHLHVNEKGIFLPDDGFIKALRAGSNFAGLKDGQRRLASLLEATVFVNGDLLFGRNEPDYIHEVWGRVPPRTGAMVVVRRPALSAGWELPFRLLVTSDKISEAQLKLALDQGGMLNGLGSWRPKYGRFKVVEWTKEVEQM